MKIAKTPAEAESIARFGVQPAKNKKEMQYLEVKSKLNHGAKIWQFGEKIQIIAINKKNAVKKAFKYLTIQNISYEYLKEIGISATCSLPYFRKKISLKQLIENVIVKK